MLAKTRKSLKLGVALSDKMKLLMLAFHSVGGKLRYMVQPLVNSYFVSGRLKLSVRHPHHFKKIIRIELRREDLSSDYLSLVELIFDDCYRWPVPSVPDVIIDGGSNTGLFSVITSSIYPDAKCVVFEPLSSNVTQIERHFRMNGLSDFELHREALVKREGSVKFFLRNANNSSLDGGGNYVDVIEVPGRNLTTLLSAKTFSVALIKLDIEGAEMEVIPELLTEFPDKTLYITGELHQWPVHLTQLRRAAESAGYTLETFNIDPVCLLFRLFKAVETLKN